MIHMLCKRAIPLCLLCFPLLSIDGGHRFQRKRPTTRQHVSNSRALAHDRQRKTVGVVLVQGKGKRDQVGVCH